MSHIVLCSMEVKSLPAVKAACKRLGMEFRQGQKTFRWFGVSVGDYPVPDGIKPAQIGQCDHALHVPGVNYEVGLRQNAKTGGYKLAYDFYGSHGEHDGQKLQAKVGNNCGLFMQAYGLELGKIEARARGRLVTEKVMANGIINLQIAGF